MAAKQFGPHPMIWAMQVCSRRLLGHEVCFVHTNARVGQDDWRTVPTASYDASYNLLTLMLSREDVTQRVKSWPTG